MVCGDLHPTSKCTLKKEDLTKKCSNVEDITLLIMRLPYKDLKSKLSLSIQASRSQMMNIPPSEIIEITDQSSKPGYVKNTVVHGSYVNVVKGNCSNAIAPKRTKRWC